LKKKSKTKNKWVQEKQEKKSVCIKTAEHFIEKKEFLLFLHFFSNFFFQNFFQIGDFLKKTKLFCFFFTIFFIKFNYRRIGNYHSH